MLVSTPFLCCFSLYNSLKESAVLAISTSPPPFLASVHSTQTFHIDHFTELFPGSLMIYILPKPVVDVLTSSVLSAALDAVGHTLPLWTLASLSFWKTALSWFFSYLSGAHGSFLDSLFLPTWFLIAGPLGLSPQMPSTVSPQVISTARKKKAQPGAIRLKATQRFSIATRIKSKVPTGFRHLGTYMRASAYLFSYLCCFFLCPLARPFAPSAELLD